MLAYPWTEPDIMPISPEGSSEWGVQHQKNEHFAMESQRDMEEIVGSDLKGEILYGWSPNSHRIQPIECLVPDAVLRRDHAIRRSLFIKELLGFICSIALIIGAIYALANGIDLLGHGAFFLLLIAFAILETGLNDFLVHRWENRQYRNNPQSLLSRKVAHKFFMTWLQAQPKLLGLSIPSVCVLLFILQWSTGFDQSIIDAGLVKSDIPDEPFRLLTCGLLHGGPIHVGFNALIAYILSTLLVPLLGIGRVVGVFMLTVLTGSLLSWWWSPVTSVGASGGVLGLSGALVGLAIRNPVIRSVGVLGPQIRWIGLLCIIGLIGAGFIDNAAHLGGYVGGLMCGLMLAPPSAVGFCDKRSFMTDPLALFGMGVFGGTALFLALKLLGIS